MAFQAEDPSLRATGLALGCNRDLWSILAGCGAADKKVAEALGWLFGMSILDQFSGPQPTSRRVLKDIVHVEHANVLVCLAKGHFSGDRSEHIEQQAISEEDSTKHYFALLCKQEIVDGQQLDADVDKESSNKGGLQKDALNNKQDKSVGLDDDTDSLDLTKSEEECSETQLNQKGKGPASKNTTLDMGFAKPQPNKKPKWARGAVDQDNIQKSTDMFVLALSDCVIGKKPLAIVVPDLKKSLSFCRLSFIHLQNPCNAWKLEGVYKEKDALAVLEPLRTGTNIWIKCAAFPNFCQKVFCDDTRLPADTLLKQGTHQGTSAAQCKQAKLLVEFLDDIVSKIHWKVVSIMRKHLVIAFKAQPKRIMEMLVLPNQYQVTFADQVATALAQGMELPWRGIVQQQLFWTKASMLVGCTVAHQRRIVNTLCNAFLANVGVNNVPESDKMSDTTENRFKLGWVQCMTKLANIVKEKIRLCKWRSSWTLCAATFEPPKRLIANSKTGRRSKHLERKVSAKKFAKLWVAFWRSKCLQNLQKRIGDQLNAQTQTGAVGGVAKQEWCTEAKFSEVEMQLRTSLPVDFVCIELISLVAHVTVRNQLSQVQVGDLQELSNATALNVGHIANTSGGSKLKGSGQAHVEGKDSQATVTDKDQRWRGRQHGEIHVQQLDSDYTYRFSINFMSLRPNIETWLVQEGKVICGIKNTNGDERVHKEMWDVKEQWEYRDNVTGERIEFADTERKTRMTAKEVRSKSVGHLQRCLQDWLVQQMVIQGVEVDKIHLLFGNSMFGTSRRGFESAVYL
ncbi:hypothetical protein M427DRAFT_43532 [Gonapodya prolifera JEL478]|uniref:Uncharacterized protein n=1 Tax=Gonapodya prolifera (strain JEL478) TaxID=1344416 RepID=A0A139AI00_GONPJ|nr:hypothetical protein M427DRAFT_43532 [Gonapodya prolifera JEL478]|eukprot:KXS16427.1 hypothetical protein M427DRAFT_43532 [Gonapodya prolifera JEL478]